MPGQTEKLHLLILVAETFYISKELKSTKFRKLRQRFKSTSIQG
ncbi:hypothetical protein INT48_006763 [Thamnidium elegans]|uniref:Uncharacterized protein n=1 Tax=Thamnidium elegans TaxID=101142 RepID=A0A8H7SJH6_9FUNG|nr:hypothetical protein INT48_006763 [Thamnidium elegans]